MGGTTVSFRVPVVRFTGCDGPMKRFYEVHILNIGCDIFTTCSNTFVPVFFCVHQPSKALLHSVLGCLPQFFCKFIDRTGCYCLVCGSRSRFNCSCRFQPGERLPFSGAMRPN